MIRFFKEIYLTGFTLVFRFCRSKIIANKAGGAVAVITVIEWFLLLGIYWYVDIFINKKIIFSNPVVIIAFFALFLINGHILFFRRHGIKFAQEFESFKKSKRILLVTSFVVLSVAAIVFGICSAIAHRHFIGVH